MPIYPILIIYLIIFTFLLIINYLRLLDNRSRLFILALIIFEGFNSLFSIGSYLPSHFGLLILIVGLYLIKNELDEYSLNSNKPDYLGINDNYLNLFPYIGFLGICFIHVFNTYLRNDTYGSNDFLAIFLCTILILYKKINFFNSYIVNFTLISLFISNILLVIPRLLYFISEGSIEESFDNKVVYYFLNLPINQILTALGFDVFSKSSVLKFYTIQGTMESVDIGRTCSGLHSVAIFISAFMSYSILENRKLDSSTFNYTILGILVSYFANLLRMLIIVLVGIYIDFETMMWVHSHLGWVIFTIWIFLFWNFYDKIHNKTISKSI